MARRQFPELVKVRSYLDIKARELPSLQRRVYDVLRNLKPYELEFILSNDFPKIAINQNRVDRDTHYVICAILKDLLEAGPHLLLTSDDIHAGWQRFKELLFLRQGVIQGILKEEVVEGESYYYAELPDRPSLPLGGDKVVRVENNIATEYMIWRDAR